MLQGVDFQNFSRDTNFAKQMISMIRIFFAASAFFFAIFAVKSFYRKGRKEHAAKFAKEDLYRTLPILSTGQYPKTALP